MSQVLNDNQWFSLNGESLSGVTSASVSYSNSIELSPTLGSPNFGFIVNGPFQTTVSISRLLSENDVFLNYTGQLSFSGAFNYGGKNYSFASGFLSNYSLNCGVGQPPEASVDISVFCELKTGVSEQSPFLFENLFLPSPKSISISGESFSGNRVGQFNYSLTFERQPVYSIEGGRSAEDVVLVLPIKCSSSVEIDASEENMNQSYSLSREVSDNSVNILVKDRSISKTLFNLPVQNAQISRQSLSLSDNGKPVKNIEFLGFLS